MSSTKTIRDIAFGVPLINTRGACRPSLHIGCRFNGYLSIITSRVHTLESMQYCILISYLKKAKFRGNYFFGYLLSISVKNSSAFFGSIFLTSHCSISLFLSSSSLDWGLPTYQRKVRPATCQINWRNSDCQFSNVSLKLSCQDWLVTKPKYHCPRIEPENKIKVTQKNPYFFAILCLYFFITDLRRTLLK